LSRRSIIRGTAGHDFHTLNTVFRDDLASGSAGPLTPPCASVAGSPRRSASPASRTAWGTT